MSVKDLYYFIQGYLDGDFLPLPFRVPTFLISFREDDIRNEVYKEPVRSALIQEWGKISRDHIADNKFLGMNNLSVDICRNGNLLNWMQRVQKWYKERNEIIARKRLMETHFFRDIYEEDEKPKRFPKLFYIGDDGNHRTKLASQSVKYVWGKMTPSKRVLGYPSKEADFYIQELQKCLHNDDFNDFTCVCIPESQTEVISFFDHAFPFYTGENSTGIIFRSSLWSDVFATSLSSFIKKKKDVYLKNLEVFDGLIFIGLECNKREDGAITDKLLRLFWFNQKGEIQKCTGHGIKTFLKCILPLIVSSSKRKIQEEEEEVGHFFIEDPLAGHMVMSINETKESVKINIKRHAFESFDIDMKKVGKGVPTKYIAAIAIYCFHTKKVLIAQSGLQNYRFWCKKLGLKLFVSQVSVLRRYGIQKAEVSPHIFERGFWSGLKEMSPVDLYLFPQQIEEQKDFWLEKLKKVFL